VVATDVGVYLSDNGGSSWLKLGSGLPLAPIDAIQYQAATNQIFAATFGRGMWSVALAAPSQDVPEGPMVALFLVVGGAVLAVLQRRRRTRI
jgi:hypothetical protein